MNINFKKQLENSMFHTALICGTNFYWLWLILDLFLVLKKVLAPLLKSNLMTITKEIENFFKSIFLSLFIKSDCSE